MSFSIRSRSPLPPMYVLEYQPFLFSGAERTGAAGRAATAAGAMPMFRPAVIMPAAKAWGLPASWIFFLP